MKDTGLLDWEKLEEAAAIFKSLGHPLRLRMVEILEHGEMSVKELQSRLGTQQSHTSQQLNRMKTLGLLKARRQGNQVFYSVARPAVFKILDCLRKDSQEDLQNVSGDLYHG
ncbi:MAG: winged helix-turn-helix transcriptional regulator [Deltaproteobacteria bacterium]|nr:winged helix-turn-helix transcriptional regulator [Deltaproteobacteria bacterium]